MAFLFALAPDGVYQAALLPTHWCAFTAPFQLFSCMQGSLLFCGTDPSGRPAQPLAGILPLGARTFLMLAHAIARLTRGGSIHRSSNDVYGRRCGPIGHLILLLQAALTGEARLAPAFKAI